MTPRKFRQALFEAIEDQDWAELERLKQNDELVGEVLMSRAFQSEFVSVVSELDQEALRSLIAMGCDVNKHDAGKANSGIYPLETCVSENNFDNARILLEHNANPNICDALLELTEIDNSHDQIRMCELLLNHGAHINKAPETLPEFTPIVNAIENNALELVEYLKSRGAIEPDFDAVEERTLDLETFQTRLESACREFWCAMQNEYPTETFCLFGLETDSDFVIVNGLVDTEEAVERDQRKRKKVDSYIARVSLDSDSEFYGKAEPYLNELSLELNSVNEQEELDRETTKRMKQTKKILESTLKNLDNEGLFGTGKEREKIILLVSIIDADDGEWKTMMSIAKRLNPRSVYKQFLEGTK